MTYDDEHSEPGVAHWPKWMVDQIGIDYLDPVYKVSFSLDRDDDDMVHLGHLSQLKELQLILCQVTDEGLGHLKSLKTLQSLSLADTKFSDAGMAHLKGLRALRFFPSLTRTLVTRGWLI